MGIYWNLCSNESTRILFKAHEVCMNIGWVLNHNKNLSQGHKVIKIQTIFPIPV